jgi:hypothetical protein
MERRKRNRGVPGYLVDGSYEVDVWTIEDKKERKRMTKTEKVQEDEEYKAEEEEKEEEEEEKEEEKEEEMQKKETKKPKEVEKKKKEKEKKKEKKVQQEGQKEEKKEKKKKQEKKGKKKVEKEGEGEEREVGREEWYRNESKRCVLTHKTKAAIMEEIEKEKPNATISSSKSKSELVDFLVPPLKPSFNPFARPPTPGNSSIPPVLWSSIPPPKIDEDYKSLCKQNKTVLQAHCRNRNMKETGSKHDLILALLDYDPETWTVPSKANHHMFSSPPPDPSSFSSELYTNVVLEEGKLKEEDEKEELRRLRPLILKHLTNCYCYWFRPTPSWSAYSISSSSALISSTTLEQFSFHFLGGIDHWKGDHSKCRGKCEKKQTLTSVLVEEGVRKVMLQILTSIEKDNERRIW